MVRLVTTNPRGTVAFMSVGDPAFTSLRPGTRFDIVLRIEATEQPLVEATGLWHGEFCWVQVDRVQVGDTWTFYDLRFDGMFRDSPLLSCDQETQRFLKPAWMEASFRTMREVCAGIGGISMGLQGVGGKTICMLDRNALACETLRINQADVIQGDLGDRTTRIALHIHQAHTAAMLGAGIPCQGYSRQGQGLGFRDPRSKTMLSVLQCAWHMQVPAIVLECVTEIVHHEEAMRTLQAFADKAGYSMHYQLLELSHQWASRRHRWWCVFLPSHLPPIVLEDWPSADCNVKDVIPCWPIWPDEQEHDLTWDEAERQAFSNPAFGTDTRHLDSMSKAPTALHSWGSPLRPCPCGCRTAPFSEYRLQQRGLRGVGIHSQSTGAMRFLHPQEVALLNTVSPRFRHVANARAALCMVGQLAAPLQSLWVCAQIRRWAAEVFGGSCLTPVAYLEQYKHELLIHRHDLWILPTMMPKGILSLSDGCSQWQLQVQGPVTVAELAKAELQLQGPGLKIEICHGGRTLPSDGLLHVGSLDPYVLLISRKKQARSVSQPVCTATPRGDPPVSVANPQVPGASGDLASQLRPHGCSDIALYCGLHRIQQSHAGMLLFPPAGVETILRSWHVLQESAPLPTWPVATCCF